jgi:alkanesulfonate monooxygenase SsuD/methylene tetrahydromethanopterin reductase-like flavin-dependent oxidoreductase (luciferase family)
MSDYGHDLRFGAMLSPATDWPGEVLALAELTERVGLDLVSLSDHPYWTGRLDTMALLATIAARTTRVSVFPNCANLPLRPPVTLARTAATIDLVSGGRFELGVAAGAQQLWDSILADGGPRRSAGESLAALEEAIQVIRALWAADNSVRFGGAYYQLVETAAGPRPAHDISIIVGGYRRRMLQLIGRAADGWIPSSPYLPPEHLPVANAIIDEAAAMAGRVPGDVVRAYNVGGTFATSAAGFLNGPPRLWAEQLAEVALGCGVSIFILYQASSGDLIRQFAAEVAPAVRQIVDKERSPERKASTDAKS